MVPNGCTDRTGVSHPPTPQCNLGIVLVVLAIANLLAALGVALGARFAFQFGLMAVWDKYSWLDRERAIAHDRIRELLGDTYADHWTVTLDWLFGPVASGVETTYWILAALFLANALCAFWLAHTVSNRNQKRKTCV